MMTVNWCMRTDAEETKQDDPKAKFRAYVHAISGKARVKMLSPVEEKDCLRRWLEQQDRAALTRLVTAFDPMIMTLAMRIAANHGAEHAVEEIYQQGLEFFIRALPRFDIASGNRLSSFVKYSVVGGMTREAMDLRMPMRTTTSLGEKRAYFRYRAAVDDFRRDNGRSPGDGPADLADISARLGCTPQAFKRARTTHTAQVMPIDRVEVWTPDLGPDDSLAVRALIEGEFAKLGNMMSDRDVAIARAFLIRVGDTSPDGPWAQAVGESFSLSPERIRQIARHALALIRTSLAERGVTCLDDVVAAS